LALLVEVVEQTLMLSIDPMTSQGGHFHFRNPQALPSLPQQNMSVKTQRVIVAAK